MKNKTELQKYLRIACAAAVLFVMLCLRVERVASQKEQQNINRHIANMIAQIQEHYPDVSDDEIMTILQQDGGDATAFLHRYSIDPDTDSILSINQEQHNMFVFVKGLILILAMGTVLVIFLIYNHTKDTSIASITHCIEEINQKNYALDIEVISEDELSILKSEIYKTTLMLKEQAENSNKGRIQLKESLSDISHQIKTPLTSIMILLDNMIDDPQMKEETRNEFLKQIKVETTNIHFLVQSLLKLSSLDADTVTFFNQPVQMKQLVSQAIAKNLPLCDLKNVRIHNQVQSTDTVVCDAMWQIEALSNIVKNCVEHSEDGGMIEITGTSNLVYTMIQIQDHGCGISEVDLPHIFERFYKGKNSGENSVGIGLALAKSIVEKNHGSIQVDSLEGKGTCFTVKYFKV